MKAKTHPKHLNSSGTRYLYKTARCLNSQHAAFNSFRQNPMTNGIRDSHEGSKIECSCWNDQLSGWHA